MTATRLSTAARILAGLAAVLALGAFAGGIPAVLDADDQVVLVEAWRTIGFATFAALFGYLAVRPGAIGVWVIVLANKVALTVMALVLRSAAGASTSAVWDGVLVVVLGVGLLFAVLADRARTASES